MSLKEIIFSCVAVLFCTAAAASPVRDTVVVAKADTVAVASDENFTDEDLMKLVSSQVKDTVVKKVDKGRDVSSAINARRQRTADFTPFVSEKFSDNTFVSFRGTSLKIATPDYSFGAVGGLSYGKWFHQDHAARVNYDYGIWHDNFDGSPIHGMELSATYMFNLSAYVGGYRTNRLCEVIFEAGAGYANSLLVRTPDDVFEDVPAEKRMGHAFTAHAGAMLNLRAFKKFDFFVEPQAVLYTNGMAMSYGGNWRKWMAAFRASFGISYNMNTSPYPDSRRLRPREDGWFVHVMSGPHFQNSALVYDHVGMNEAFGVHFSLGLGKYYTDYFGMRFSGAYYRGDWVTYETVGPMPCNYFAVRAEAMLDMFSLIKLAVDRDKKKSRKAEDVKPAGNGRFPKRPFFAASILVGPEIGYMYKVDIEDVIATPYVGITGGVQAKFNLTSRFSLFIEPRFSVMPYDAPAHDYTTLNDNRNYYDGLINLNAGIEFLL